MWELFCDKKSSVERSTYSNIGPCRILHLSHPLTDVVDTNLLQMLIYHKNCMGIHQHFQSSCLSNRCFLGSGTWFLDVSHLTLFLCSQSKQSQWFSQQYSWLNKKQHPKLWIHISTTCTFIYLYEKQAKNTGVSLTYDRINMIQKSLYDCSTSWCLHLVLAQNTKNVEDQFSD